MSTIKKYQPKYYKSFRCIGSECRNNCCNSWKINIDKNTYDKYMNLDEDTKKEFSEKLQLIEDGDKGVITKLDKKGNCMFLNEVGLCTIQLKYGHEYLSTTCRTYPRLTFVVGGCPELFLELSCEAAANIILFDKGYMGFDEYEVDQSDFLSGTIVCNSSLDTEKYTKEENGIDIFWKLRVTCMAIIQSRKYRVRLRMLILCMFIQEVNDYFAAGRDSDVINLAEVYLSRIESNYFDELVDGVPTGVNYETDVMIDILKEMYVKRGPLFRQSVAKALEGFDIDISKWVFPDSFEENYKRSYETFLADKEYIFENYLAHRVLSEGFPFNYKGTGDVMSNYIDLLAKYNIVEFLFTGICRSVMKFDKKRIIDCISIFTRSYEHSFTKYLKAEELKLSNQ